MSLKVFHLIFIFLATLLAIGCAAWSFTNHTAEAFGVGSAVVAAGLIVYGIWFVKKARGIIG
jgi:hypothetical protein